MNNSSSKNSPTFLKAQKVKTYDQKDREILRPYSMQIALTLAGGRNRKGLTQAQLASKAKVPQSTISTLESGWTNVTLRNLIKVANFLEIPMVQFFADSRKLIKIFKEEEIQQIATNKIWPMGVNVVEMSLADRESRLIEIPRFKQLAVKVLKGEAHIRADYLGTVQWIQEKETAIIPGGDEIVILGMWQAGLAEILMVETPVGEGRY